MQKKQTDKCREIAKMYREKHTGREEADRQDKT